MGWNHQIVTLQGTNISPKNGILKMIFLFPRWDMLIPWRVKLEPLFFFGIDPSAWVATMILDHPGKSANPRIWLHDWARWIRMMWESSKKAAGTGESIGPTTKA